MLTHPHVRNLTWVIQSYTPYALDGLLTWTDDSDWFDEFLHNLNHDPAPLEQHLAQLHSRALGHYVESLWQFYFIHHPDYTLLAHNVQIIIDKRTLGELDLIVREHATGRVLHIELSCKFYMNVANRNTLAPLNNWYGPNLSDNLDSKYSKTLSQQLPFAQQPKVCDYLNQRGIRIDTSVAIFKGRTFYPHDAQSLALPQDQHTAPPITKASSELNATFSAKPHDQWLTLSTFAQHAKDTALSAQHFRPLSKPQWLASQRLKPSAQSLSNSTAATALLNTDQLLTHIRNIATTHNHPSDALMNCAAIQSSAQAHVQISTSASTDTLLDFAPLQVACFESDGTTSATDYHPIECQRLFIVSDRWWHNAQQQWALDKEER